MFSDLSPCKNADKDIGIYSPGLASTLYFGGVDTLSKERFKLFSVENAFLKHSDLLGILRWSDEAMRESINLEEMESQACFWNAP